MKKTILTIVVALMATVAVKAQQIAVVSGNSTDMFRTLQEAIEGASSGGVIYLPGGVFQISDDVKITKKLTIIGIGHCSKNENVEGTTTINGNLWFNENSDGSAILGCYVTGNINIGKDGSAVNYVLIRYNNVNSVQVHNSNCMETIVNQNYLRSTSFFGGSNPQISNNIMHSIGKINCGYITYNIIISNCQYAQRTAYSWAGYAAIVADNSRIQNNVIFEKDREQGYAYYHAVSGSVNEIRTNMVKSNIGENDINIGDVSWSDVFKNYSDISPNSDFQFSDDYKQYESQVGIYAGNSFNDKQVAPVPYIVAKKVDEQTDAAGKLQIKIRVKASE